MGKNYDKPGAGVNGGWFAVTRAAFDHAIIGIHARAFTDFEAWAWLIAFAAHEPTEADGLALQRGQLTVSQRYLAARWRWTHDKVRWFLKRLENEGMINTTPNTTANTTRADVITVINYGQYQPARRTQHHTQHPTSHHKVNNKEQSISSNEEISTLDIECLEAFTTYNQLALQLGLPQAATLTPARKQRLKARLKEHGGITGWQKALANLKTSRFLQGDNDRGWRANFEWLVTASSFNKLVDGAYGTGKPRRLGDVVRTVRDTSIPWKDEHARLVAEGKGKPAEGKT